MPSFTFSSPEGKQYTVNGPEGATAEQAFGMLQQQLGGQQTGPSGFAANAADFVKSMPRGAVGNLAGAASYAAC